MLNGLVCWARISWLILATFWGLSPPANVIDASGMRSWMALAIFVESSTLMGIALPADKSMMNLLVASWYNLHCSAIRSGLQSSSSTAARVVCRMMTALGLRLESFSTGSTGVQAMFLGVLIWTPWQFGPPASRAFWSSWSIMGESEGSSG